MVKSWGWGGLVGGGPCDYCVSPSPNNWVWGSELWVRILGLLGQGIGDFNSGLTIMILKLLNSFIYYKLLVLF